MNVFFKKLHPFWYFEKHPQLINFKESIHYIYLEFEGGGVFLATILLYLNYFPAKSLKNWRNFHFYLKNSHLPFLPQKNSIYRFQKSIHRFSGEYRYFGNHWFRINIYLRINPVKITYFESVYRVFAWSLECEQTGNTEST